LLADFVAHVEVFCSGDVLIVACRFQPESTAGTPPLQPPERRLVGIHVGQGEFRLTHAPSASRRIQHIERPSARLTGFCFNAI